MITKPRHWTRWRVLRTLTDMLAELDAEKNVKSHTIYLKELFVKRKISRETFSRWGEFYADDEEIRDAVSIMRDILETRVVVGALRKHLDGFITTMHLKNNYGWKEDPDQSERDDRRLEIEIDTTRVRIADQRRKNLLGNGDTTDEKPA